MHNSCAVKASGNHSDISVNKNRNGNGNYFFTEMESKNGI